MNDNQILVVHSRWVYNFMGIILEAQVSFIFFFAFMHSFQKFSFRFLVIFKPYTLEETVIEKALHANECEEMNRGIHCKSGTSFMGLAVNAGISIWNEACSAFLNRDAKSCIDCEPIKDVPDLQWMLLFISSHSFACSAFSMTVSSNV